MRRRFRFPLLAIPALLFAGGCEPQPAVPAGANPSGDELRVVTLAPHLAELVFAVGAGEMLVGVSSYTDYPAEAAALPVVGDAFSVDRERLALLRPDLLLAWESGTPARRIGELRALGFRVETIETRGLDDIAAAIEQVGLLTGHERKARQVAEAFRAGLRRIAEEYAAEPPIDVFYQVSQQPLYTVNGDHYVSELIEICGGANVFADLSGLAPMVDVEAVLARNPEVMLASADNPPDVFDVWRRWSGLAANRYDNYFFLPAGEIGRATPRLVEAGETLCAVLEQARERRAREPAR